MSTFTFILIWLNVMQLTIGGFLVMTIAEWRHAAKGWKKAYDISQEIIESQNSILESPKRDYQ